MYTEIDRIKLHFKYCALIALLIFIGIATDRWSSSKDFTTYLSNAATMTSLFLGIVAILYSFVSNDSMSKSLGSISTITSEVRDVRGEVEQFVDIAKQTNEAGAKNNADINTASQGISKTIQSLNATLDSLTQQNKELRNLIETIPTRIEQIGSKVDDVAKAIGEKSQPPNATPNDIPNNLIDKTLARAALNYNLFMHACVLASKTQKNLSLEAFCEAITWNAPNMCQGFLSGMHYTQICNRKMVADADKCFTITSIHPRLLERSKSYYMDYIENAYKDQPDEHKQWLEKMANVEALFAPNPAE